MDYKNLHDQIIARSKTRKLVDCYFESHHVVPKSMGGTDADENIVALTGREHYLIHWLLYKIHKCREMAFAWYRMSHGKRSVGRYVSHTFQYARTARAKAMSDLFTGRKLSVEHKEKLCAAKIGKSYSDIGRNTSPLKGRELTDEHKKKLGLASKGRTRTEESRAAQSMSMSGALNHQFGKSPSVETRRKLSEAIKKVRSIPMSAETRKKLSDAQKLAWERKRQSTTP